MAKLISGKEVSAQIRQKIKEEAQALRENSGIQPGLAVILVGNDPASQIYVRNKQRACEEVGFHAFEYRLNENSTEEQLLDLILIDADEKDEKAKQAAVQQAIGRLIREFSTEKKKAEEVVTYFTNALQWKLPAAAAEKTGAVNAAANPAAPKPAAKAAAPPTQKQQPAVSNASRTSPNPASQNATFSPAATPGTATPPNAAIAGQPNPAATPNGQNPRQQAPNATFQGAQPYPVPPVPNGQAYPNGTIAPKNANGALQNNPNGTLNPENAAVKKKKKSPLGYLIAIVHFSRKNLSI